MNLPGIISSLFEIIRTFVAFVTLANERQKLKIESYHYTSFYYSDIIEFEGILSLSLFVNKRFPTEKLDVTFRQ